MLWAGLELILGLAEAVALVWLLAYLLSLIGRVIDALHYALTGKERGN
jgi:hypothetical protein